MKHIWNNEAIPYIKRFIGMRHYKTTKILYKRYLEGKDYLYGAYISDHKKKV